MRHVEELTERCKELGSPAHEIGAFLLRHTNTPEYLVNQLEAYLAAARRDLTEERQRFRLLSKKEE